MHKDALSTVLILVMLNTLFLMRGLIALSNTEAREGRVNGSIAHVTDTEKTHREMCQKEILAVLMESHLLFEYSNDCNSCYCGYP